MIVLINGAFGVGKSTTASELIKRLPNAIIYDPEEVGFMLRSIIPESVKPENEKTGDFQDLELWRVLVVEVAEQIKRRYGCNLIVPMTLRNKDYFDYIYAGLKSIDQGIFCFCLTASKECIHSRLEYRGDTLGSWAYQQTDGYIKAYSSDSFGEYVDTESKDINEVVDYIMSKLETI